MKVDPRQSDPEEEEYYAVPVIPGGTIHNDTGFCYDMAHECHRLTQEATQRQGDGYHLTGDIQTSILQTTPKGQGTVELRVKSAGTWVYQFTPGQLSHLKTIVAGKSKAQATSALLQVPGVQSVSLSIKNGNTLPTDTSHIQIALLAYAL